MRVQRPITSAGLVAHDRRKDALVAWTEDWREPLSGLRLFATGTTGGRIRAAIPELDIVLLKSGPLGQIDALFFFVDPLSPHPHDVDVKALIRMATLADIPFACNRATADAIMLAQSVHSHPGESRDP